MSASDTAHDRPSTAAAATPRAPHQAVDPVLIAGSLVMALQSVVARNVDPLPDGHRHRRRAARRQGRQRDPRQRHAGAEHPLLRPRRCATALEQRITRAGRPRTRRATAASVEIDYERGYPVVVNSEAETAFARAGGARNSSAPTRVIAPFPPVTGSEDFAYYLLHKPGCFLRLGNGDGAMLGHPAVDFNDAILTIGAAYWTRLAQRYLEALRAPGPGCARGPSRTRRPGRCGVTAPSRCTQQPATQVPR
jgi:hippurate hydrolase